MPASASFTSPLAEALAEECLERFQRYVRIDTQSRREATESPSTPGQLELGRLLVDELRGAGLEDAALDENGYVMATLASPRRYVPAGPTATNGDRRDRADRPHRH